MSQQSNQQPEKKLKKFYLSPHEIEFFRALRRLGRKVVALVTVDEKGSIALGQVANKGIFSPDDETPN